MKKIFCLIAIVSLSVAFTSCKSTEIGPRQDQFIVADANHDGKLTWDEWNVPGSNRTKKQFDAADTNHDGFVSLEEARAYGRKVHLFEKEFREADKNHDGYVTMEEAKAYYASKEGPPR